MSKTVIQISAPIDKVTAIANMMQSMREPGANKLSFILLMLKAMQLALTSDKLSNKDIMKAIYYAARNMADGIYKCNLELPEGSDDYNIEKFS